mmetsp:Transcript_12813/g.20746  ORF Transcript_12813/g.20746 Transcript_12813/m.20746 type:complete len:90 (-) Transcript_12813:57-326(-)
MTYIKPCSNYSELHCIQEDSSFNDMKARPRPSMSRGAHQSAPLPLRRLYHMEDTEDVLGENEFCRLNKYVVPQGKKFGFFQSNLSNFRE